MRKLKTLVVDDQASWRKEITYHISNYCDVDTASNLEEGILKIVNNQYDIAILDLKLSEGSTKYEGLKLIEPAVNKNIFTIVLSAQDHKQYKEQAFNLGAQYYYVKSDKNVYQSIEKEVLKHIANIDKFFEDIIFQNTFKTRDEDFLKQLSRIAPQIGDNDSILILGPTGTGKTELANKLHQASRRKGQFVAKSCAEMANLDIMRSELFGHKKGSFTGAITDHKGLFELAKDEGTIFLDEIGELTLESQAALLTVLSSKKFTPIGSNKSYESNFRLISATSKNILEQIQQKRFSLDLYGRIKFITIEIKPLRDRKCDIMPMIEYFTKDMEFKFTKDAENLLLNHTWETNIREIQEFSKKIKSIKRIGQTIGANDVKNIITTSKENIFSNIENEFYNLGFQLAKTIPYFELEKQLRNKVLQSALDNSKSFIEAAELIGVNKVNIYRAIRNGEIVEK